MESCLLNGQSFAHTNTIINHFDIKTDLDEIRKYLLALLLEDKYFSIQKFSKTTPKRTPEKFFRFLKRKVNWQKIFCRLAKLVLALFSTFGFYLATGSTPLKQGSKSAREMFELYLTNGKIYIPMFFDIYERTEADGESNYRKKQELLLTFLKKFLAYKIPVNKILFGSFLNSPAVLDWLNKNEFKLMTGIKQDECEKSKTLHRESMQKMGLKNCESAELQNLVNHVGFVCLSYSLLTILQEKFAASIGNIKFSLNDEFCCI